MTACCNILEICLNVCDFLRAGLETNWVFLRTADGPKASVMVVSNASWALEGKGQFSAAINFIEKLMQDRVICHARMYHTILWGPSKKGSPEFSDPNHLEMHHQTTCVCPCLSKDWRVWYNCVTLGIFGPLSIDSPFYLPRRSIPPQDIQKH